MRQRVVSCFVIAVAFMVGCSKKGEINGPPSGHGIVLDGAVTVPAGSLIEASSLVVFSANDSTPISNGAYKVDIGADSAGEVVAACAPDGNPVLIGFWTAGGKLDLSPAGTATALVLLNPYFLGTTASQLSSLRTRVEAVGGYSHLTEMISDAMISRGSGALLGDDAAGIYRLANQIATEVYSANSGSLTKTAHSAGTVDDAPTVVDAPGNDVEFVNPYGIYYGVGIYPQPGGTRSAVVGLPGGDYYGWPLVGSPSPNHLTYPLGGGQFRIVIDKGGGNGSYPFSIDPSTEWGLASLANVAQGAWYVIGDVLRVAGSKMGQGWLKSALGSAKASELVQFEKAWSGRMGKVDLARDIRAGDALAVARDFAGMVTENPEKSFAAFRGLIPSLPQVSGSLLKQMGSVLDGILGALDASDQLRFSYDLVTAPQGRTVTVMQMNGTMGPIQYLVVQTPNGGEKWVAGTTQRISWVRENVDNVIVSYSTDNGNSWTLIQIASGSTYDWVVPEQISSTCAVRVADGVDQFPVDESDAPFSIVSAPDVISPAAVADLAAGSPTENSLTLYWTAPGDDGNIGTAWSYDIRYSTNPITGPQTWDLATRASGEPKPRPAGSTEAFLVSGLSPGTSYYFGIKSADYSANASALSKIATGTTASPVDFTPPAVIFGWYWGGDNTVTATSVSLWWTAPGDDGRVGTAAQYDIRYATSTITDANWNLATQVDGEPRPQPAGSDEFFEVTGLHPNTTYYFAMKTADEVPNWSALSEVWSVTTLDIDDTAPAAIANLQATNPTQTSVTLNWTAPGDDLNSGTASQYDIRYSTSDITTATWEAATQATGAPSPKLAGSVESFVVTGLSPSTTYYFALKTADEVPNWSALSNVAVDTTLPPAGLVCSVMPETLSFGDVALTDSADLTFSITNTGQGILTGQPSSPCGEYRIVAGGESYSLGPGLSRTVTVRFRPAVLGPRNCDLPSGTNCAVNVHCTGNGTPGAAGGWASLGSGMNYTVWFLTVYNDQLIAGGQFTTAGGDSADHIAAWNGASWSPLGSGTNYSVDALTVYNGQLIAGGYFTTAGGNSAIRVAAWNGASWSQLGSGMNSTVRALNAYNGQLIAGGQFSTAGSVSANGVAAWNGTSWSPLGSGMNYSVNALTVYNGQLIAGGQFTTAGGISANGVAAWNGASWSPLGSGMGMPYEVVALTVYNGQLIAGGQFTTAGGVSANGVAAWNGASWSPLGPGMNYRVNALTVYNGQLIAGGESSSALGHAVVATWNGASWMPLGWGMSDGVAALTVYNGQLIAGGGFTFAGSVYARGIAAWSE